MTVFSKPVSLQQQTRIPALIVLAIILVARRQILHLSKLALSRRPQLQAPKATPEELKEAIKQLYVDEADGSRTVLVPFRDRVSKVRSSSSLLPLISSWANANECLLYQVRLNLTPKEHFTRDIPHFRPIDKTHKPNVDKTFMRQLFALLRVTFPSWRSKEFGMLCLHSFFLVLRTVLSLYVARLDGRIVRDIVSADGTGFLKGLGWWFALAVPSTYTNSMVRAVFLAVSWRSDVLIRGECRFGICSLS